jgi:hypothetical protein
MPVDAPTNQTRRPDHSVIGAFSCNQPRAWAFEDEAFDVVGPTLGIAGSATTVAATVAAPVVTKCASVTGRFMWPPQTEVPAKLFSAMSFELFAEMSFELSVACGV